MLRLPAKSRWHSLDVAYAFPGSARVGLFRGYFRPREAESLPVEVVGKVIGTRV